MTATATVSVSDTSWLERAACGNADPADFDTMDPEYAGRALKACDGCPVAAQCLVRMLGTDSPGKGLGFEGVAAGQVWRNGRPDPGLTRRARKRWWL